jgi:hypothetical protein
MMLTICRFAAVAVAAMALGVTAEGQRSAPCTPGVNGYVGYGTMPKVGTPYSATVKTTFEQRLPDGNSIRGITRARQARDSSGKTLSEMVTGCERGEDGQPHERLQVNVDDPVTKTHMFWHVQVSDVDPKIVRVSHSEERSRPQQTPEEVAARRKASQLQQPPRSEWHTDDLGTKMIDGVMAKGWRSVRTISAGEEGNELPLEIVDESWDSRDLGMALLRIHDDPRHGKTTTEFEELNLGEPPQAMFAPPEGERT